MSEASENQLEIMRGIIMQNAAQLGFKLYIFSRRFRVMIITALLSFTLVLIMYSLFAARYAIADLAVYSATPSYSVELSNYNGLTAKEQKLYEKLDKAILELKEFTAVMPYSFTEAELAVVKNALRCDRPEYFYIDFDSITLYTSRRRTRAAVAFNTSADNIESMKAELDAAIQSALTVTADAQDETGRELALHDYLIDSCRRVSDAAGIADSAYGALVNGEASADAYALAMKLLLNADGISAMAVSGSAAGNPHIWNIVYTDGGAYHLDAAWNDPDFDFAPNLRFHAYFNLGDEQMLKDHSPDNPSQIPTAADDGDYYSYLELYAENHTELKAVIDRGVNAAVTEGRSYFELYPNFNADPDDMYELIMQTIDSVNAYVKQNDLNLPVMKKVARIFECSYTSSALTVQIFYE